MADETTAGPTGGEVIKMFGGPEELKSKGLSKEAVDKLEEEAGAPCVWIKSRDKQKDGVTPNWEIVVRRPKRAEYKLYRTQIHQPGQVAEAQERLVFKALVYPSPERFNGMLEQFPAIPEVCSKQILNLLGGETEGE